MPHDPVAPDARQSIIDGEHLRLLALGYYVSGALTILFASMFIFHFVFFLAIGSDPHFFPPPKPGQPEFPEALFRIFGAVLGLFILMGWTLGALTIYAGRCISRRRKRGFTIVMACINLLFVPVGTVLGVATLMVLARPLVKKEYEGAS